MSAFGIIFVMVGMLYALSVAIGRFTGTVPVGGFAVIVILILTIGGLIILMLGILGEYVWRIYDELRGAPLYLVKNVAGLAKGRLGNGRIQTEYEAARDEKVERSK
jgi:dolichol-phosphate mannosyltransferase